MVAPASSAGWRGRPGRFARDEDGSFIVLGLFLLICILLIGGVGVDIMRHDRERLRMQTTLDSAILAAADLDQRRDAETVVRDFFGKAGMADRVDSVTVTNDINSRVVSAEASTDIRTMFLKMVGIDTIANATRGTAREDIRDIEVSLVLDVSTSMEGRPLSDLKRAAKSFVSDVLLEPDGGLRDRVTVNLITYAEQVTIGPSMLAQFNLRDRHTYSACIDLVDTDFDSLAFNPTKLRRQAVHFDYFGDGNSFTDRGVAERDLHCFTSANSVIEYMSQDVAKLHRRIDDLVANGGTSIDVGLRWGTALLDPSLRPAFDELRRTGVVNNHTAGRPFAHDRTNTMKIVVIMTDGQNSVERQPRDDYAGARPSGVFAYKPTANPRNWEFSVKEQENGDRDRDGTSGEPFFIPKASEIVFDRQPAGGSAATEMTWAELWAAVGRNWHAKYLRSKDAVGYRGLSFWQTGIFREIGQTTKDPRMSKLCNLAKESGMIVYSVALNISEANATRLRNCASASGNYFNVNGNEITYAFRAIASTINQLKLVE